MQQTTKKVLDFWRSRAYLAAFGRMQLQPWNACHLLRLSRPLHIRLSKFLGNRIFQEENLDQSN